LAVVVLDQQLLDHLAVQMVQMGLILFLIQQLLQVAVAVDV
jgi:hypothetical protein|tara:strand:+ start:559 stop:681 length:123 start_codon:yes stop_codon:yes gene_type:complete